MPYKLRKVPRKDLYWVVDAEGKKYSKEGLPKERAEAQRRALYAQESKGKLKGGMSPQRLNYIKNYFNPLNNQARIRADILRFQGIYDGLSQEDKDEITNALREIGGSGTLDNFATMLSESDDFKALIQSFLQVLSEPPADPSAEGDEDPTGSGKAGKYRGGISEAAFENVMQFFEAEPEEDEDEEEFIRTLIDGFQEVIADFRPRDRTDIGRAINDLTGEPTLQAFLEFLLDAGNAREGINAFLAALGNYMDAPAPPPPSKASDFVPEQAIGGKRGGASRSDKARRGGANRLNINGIEYDTTGMPADVIASLPDENADRMGRYRRARAIYDWRVENDPAYRAEEERKDQARRNVVNTPEYKKQQEEAAKFDVSTLFHPGSRRVDRFPFGVPMTPQQKQQYDELFATMSAQPSRLEERAQKVAEYNAEMRRRADSPFAPIVQGLTKIADIGVKVGEKIGVPKVAIEAYKAFAPPTSEYAGAGLFKTWLGIWRGKVEDPFSKRLIDKFIPIIKDVEAKKVGRKEKRVLKLAALKAVLIFIRDDERAEVMFDLMRDWDSLATKNGVNKEEASKIATGYVREVYDYIRGSEPLPRMALSEEESASAPTPAGLPVPPPEKRVAFVPQQSRLEGQGAIPSRNVLQQMADAAYKGVAPTQIDGFQLVSATSTLKVYKQGNTIIVGIRGTVPTDSADLKADALIALGKLDSSARFQKDARDLAQIQRRFPPSQNDYYGVGHSLGGAILDEFLKRKLLKSGVSYNPAVQPQDFNSGLPNQRIYLEGDPLYAVMGKHVKGVEVRKPRKKGLFEKALGFLPSAVGKAYSGFKSHQLDNFVGGEKDYYTPDEARIQLKGIVDFCKSRSTPEERMAAWNDRFTDAVLGEVELTFDSRVIYLCSRISCPNPTYSSTTAMSINESATPKCPVCRANWTEHPEGRYKIPEEDVALIINKPVPEAASSPYAYKAVSGVVKSPKYSGTPKTPGDAAGAASKTGEGHPAFKAQLNKIGLAPAAYLNEARRKAKKAGLAWKLLGFANDGKHKLAIPDADGRIVKFGRVGYGDHIIYTFLESKKQVSEGTASKKQSVFRKSHSKIKGDWRKNPYSPNSLALEVLW